MFTLDNQRALSFHRKLEGKAGIKLDLKINDNRSTMLSVKWEPDCTKVSLHRMFLHAPHNVMQALACYLNGEQKNIDPSIKAYIEDNLHKLDYSDQIDARKLLTKGRFYNLKKIFDQINRHYFKNELKLHITWFNPAKRSKSSRITFGLFHDPLKLIKINQMLDDPYFPEYFVEFVVYHEMLHYVCPAYVDVKGIKHVHSKEFKEREKEFEHFELAQKWLHEHHDDLFSPTCKISNC